MSTLRSAYSDVLDRSAPAEAPRVHRWSYDEYARMVRSGLLNGARVELIEGRIIEIAPMGPRHFVATNLTGAVLTRVCPADHFVSTASELKLVESGPQPDVAIIPGTVRDYAGGLPSNAVLVVEVSETTLAPDRLDKASLYARANIPDYWIVNLVDDVLEVRRTPQPDPTQPSGFGYADVRVYRKGEAVSPLAAPFAPIDVAELLP